MVFYPDNVPRAGRLQQLVDSIANMQTDIEDYADRMDKKNKDIRPLIDKVLKERGIDTLDELIEKAASQLSADQQRVFRKLIDAAKKGQRLSWETLVGGLMLLPVGKAATPKAVLGLGRYAVRASNVQAIAGFFKTVEQGNPAAISSGIVAPPLSGSLCSFQIISLRIAAEKIIEEARESEAALEEAAKTAAEAGEGGTVVEEAEKGALAAARISKLLKLLGVIGFVATIVVAIIEAVQGAKQKEKLKEAIHTCQPARLCIAYYASEGANIIQQLELCSTYLETLADKEDPKSEELAKKLHDKILDNISSANSSFDWRKRERKMDAEDKKSPSYYGDDDLEFEEVVRLARAAEKDSRDLD
ncbi:hypothetical protein HGRIS_008902 [Hohenbuehelia grisea]|uniref:Uncharacterized protein n=1 Tax=Hohenbuehelia grisea TaxID=104357 RepID=A0ABR3IZG5_9AGAR